MYGEVEILQQFYEATDGTGFGPVEKILERIDDNNEGVVFVNAGCWVIAIAEDKLKDH